MLGQNLKVINGAEAGAWIKPRIEGEIGTVTSQVPKGFEAYVRVFHPALDSEGNPVPWADVADALGCTAHREMQWHALVGSNDAFSIAGSRWPGSNPWLGEMDIPTLDALRAILAAHTPESAGCFFGLCTIQGWEASFTADELRDAFLELPNGRDHIVLTGSLAAVEQIGSDPTKPGSGQTMQVAWTGEGPPPAHGPADLLWRRAPNLIWPADHAWFVVSEVDFDSTLVGGSAELVETIVESPELEAWQMQPKDSLAFDADKVNAVPGSS